jgi:hypothetical protein
MPKAAHETFSTGLVHREAKRVWDLLSDPAETAVSIVSTAEEMPTNETLEITAQLRDDLGLPPGWLFVNRFHATDLRSEDVERARRSGGRAALDEPELRLVDEVVARAAEEVAWAALNERYRKKLESESGWRLITLPFLFREEFGLPDVELLAERVGTEVGSEEHA